MDAQSEAVDRAAAPEQSFDFEQVFRTEYARIARVISRVVRDPARSEELAVEVFLKLWQTPGAQGEKATAWLYRVAVRKGLDELRRMMRRSRYEVLVVPAHSPDPEELHASAEGQERVRRVLVAMKPSQAELLLLYSHGLSYRQLASALSLNPSSVGTFLLRAQQRFRKEYVKRYGER